MEPLSLKKFTSNKDAAVVLPGYTEMYQPNRITNSKYRSFTLLQSRIFVTLIKELQDAILANMNGKNWTQLNHLFPSEKHNQIQVPIRLKDIAKPRQYHEVYEAFLQLAKINIRLPCPISKEYYCIATLFPRVELPKKVDGYSTIHVGLFKGAANKLIEIDKTATGRPAYYTCLNPL